MLQDYKQVLPDQDAVFLANLLYEFEQNLQPNSLSPENATRLDTIVKTAGSTEHPYARLVHDAQQRIVGINKKGADFYELPEDFETDIS